MKDKKILRNRLLTAEQQAKLTPAQVLSILKKGNKEFTEGKLTVRNNTKRVRSAAMGQYPKAVILSCLDSRVPVEDVFHRGIGDIFVARVAGNIINDDIVGSFELACSSGAKVILVMGHENCSAITAAVNRVKLGKFTSLLKKISPAVKEINKTFKGKKTACNLEYTNAITHMNVRMAIRRLRAKSPMIKKMEKEGKIITVGAMYNMKSGKVDFFE
ncbi:Carbonic anhydrase [Elusimicrobium minutum Pei191]|uniref:Carbonic anhydrase n=1 Tax=Elusimicrobium minutum (strain Pei191) TaxID=445932 RepID=B2KDG8_ELUMP|nr:carbonic anhydrase family protein [Elusimicrobium minutum]ACC98564.1 Carbonic anhydrase [Elusimicrobium minutum Pei191]